MAEPGKYHCHVIIHQALDYAADHGLIEVNSYNQFAVETKLFKKVKKPDDCTQVFLKTERPLIEAEAWHPAIRVTVEHAKISACDRYVYLPKEARRIIKITQDANQENNFHHVGFLFIHSGKHITPRAVDTRIHKYCNHININRKRTHNVRKSYISSLLNAGININEIRKQVGHEDERITLHNYVFNRSNAIENESDIR